MGGSVSSGQDNDELIDNLMEANYIRTPCVEKVFRVVDRAFYFLPEFRYAAYRDLAWKRGNLHLSAPCIYSEVLEHLQLEPGRSFLNIGSGTGYLSTMAGLILGPYGINHGIEIQPDVVDYAYERLEQFKKTSNGLDVFEFCEPSFVVGNGFDLSDDRKYDRIYCGAECPHTYHEHIKKYLKVNGILIMPCEEDLLKIIRTSETDWEVTSVLTVSFSTLQSPDKLSKIISIPDLQPLSLQELCRSKIRCILRHVVERENPALTEKRRRNPGEETIRRVRNRVFLRNDSNGPMSDNNYSNLGSVIFHNYRSALFRDFMRNLRHNNAQEREDSESYDTDGQIMLLADSDSSSESEDEQKSNPDLNTPSNQNFDAPNCGVSNSLVSRLTQNDSDIGVVEFVLSEDDGGDGPDSEVDLEEISAEILGHQGRFRLPTLDGYSSDGVDAESDEQQPHSSFKSNQIIRRQADEENDKQPKKLLKREKLDSGISEGSDDGKVSTSYESSFSESTFSEPMEVESDDSETARSQEVHSNETTVDGETGLKEQQRETESRPFKYRLLIEEKIRCLPLPQRLKIYLNHEREFKVEKY